VSTTLRIRRSDKERLERLAKRLGAKRLTDALRAALEAAEREAESYKGEPAAVTEALRFAKPVARSISEHVDEELAKSNE